MRRPLRKWFSTYLIIDLIGLGIGGGFALLYVLASFKIVNTNLKDIWANLSTEIIGVWLSVRIIDKVLERRTKKHRARLYLIDNLYKFLNTAQKILKWEKPKRTDVDELIAFKKWYDLRWEKRKPFFYGSELKKIQNVMKLQQPVIDMAEDLFIAYQTDSKNVDGQTNKLKELINEFEPLFEDLRDDVWEESHPDEI
jgi:hypothetical protein